MNNKNEKACCFKTSVGGQALMEGVMMRGPKAMCIAVRRPDGGIEPAADTNLRIGAEGGLLAALEAADGGQQS